MADRKEPQSTDIPTVPLRTPMFDGADFSKLCGGLDRTWIIFFERILKAIAAATTAGTPAGGGGPYIRTLLLKDTTVANDVADHVPIFVKSTALRVIGVLRRSIASDLVVRIKLNGIVLITLTIPRATPVDKAVVSTAFVKFPLADLTVLSWDVTGSDGQKDANGVATVTVEFV